MTNDVETAFRHLLSGSRRVRRWSAQSEGHVVFGWSTQQCGEPEEEQAGSRQFKAKDGFCKRVEHAPCCDSHVTVTITLTPYLQEYITKPLQAPNGKEEAEAHQS